MLSGRDTGTECQEEKRARGAWCPLVPFLYVVVSLGVGTCSLTGESFHCLSLAGILLAGLASCPSGSPLLQHLEGGCLPFTSLDAVHSMRKVFCIFHVVVHFSFLSFSHFPHVFSTISMIINPLFFLMLYVWVFTTVSGFLL